MSSDEPVSSNEEHEHCQICVKRNCPRAPPAPTVSTVPSICHMITCEFKCGFRFHACKLPEHLETCMEQRVPCINHCNGCPIVLPRKALGKHLEVCPASVMHCTMEWNRWPVYSKERQSRVPFVQDNFHAVYGQLDVALALRDQRMLNEALKAPRSTRRALRNSLTQRFPAVPLQKKHTMCAAEALPKSEETSQTMSDDDSDAPWNVAKEPPGLKTSVLNELFRATKQTTESLSAALDVATGSPSVPPDREVTDNRDTGAASVSEPTAGDAAGTNVQVPLSEEVLPCASSESLPYGKQKQDSGDRSVLNDIPVASISSDDDRQNVDPCDSLSTKGDLSMGSNDAEDQQHHEGYTSLVSGAHSGSDIDTADNVSQNISQDKNVGNTELQSGVNCQDVVSGASVVNSEHPAIENGIDAVKDVERPGDDGWDKSKDNNTASLPNDMQLGDDTEFAGRIPSTCATLHNGVETRENVSDPDGNGAMRVEVCSDGNVLSNGASDVASEATHSKEEASPAIDPVAVSTSPVDPEVDEPIISRLPQVISGDGKCAYIRPPPLPPPLTLKEILALDINLESITRYQAKPKSMYTFLCAQEFRRDEYLWHFKNVHNDIHGNLNGWLEQRCPLAHYGCTHSLRRLYPMHKGAKVVYNKILDSFGVVPRQNQRPPSDLMSDGSENKSPSSTSSMMHLRSKESTPEIFTSKDYNSAVHVNGSMSRLLEKSKPTHTSDAEHRASTSLAKQEKELANNRMTKTADASTTVLDIEAKINIAANEEHVEDLSLKKMNTLNGFGQVDVDGVESDTLSSSDISSKSSGDVFVTEHKKETFHPENGGTASGSEAMEGVTAYHPPTRWHWSLIDLPFEVLQHIGRFLDAYTLCNLALTSQMLRQVCCSLLEEKGIVIQEWEREMVDGKPHWHIGYKRWLFSTAFSPVRAWGFEDQVHMSEHLKSCHFYHKLPKAAPFVLPGVDSECEHSEEFWPALLRMYPEYQKPEEEDALAPEASSSSFASSASSRMERAEHGSDVLPPGWDTSSDSHC